MKLLIYYLIFPGFLFTAALGIFSSWFDRKLSARLQWRQGPPFLQPLYDLVKLLGKELILPGKASVWTFLLFPLLGLSSAVLSSTILWLAFIIPGRGFMGDVIVVIYLLTMPAVSLIISSFSSANPLASLGASREMKLMLSYELPFILCCTVALIKANTIKLGELILYQQSHGFIINSFSGAIAFAAILLCVQAKLGLTPFDIAEAETEIMAGSHIEFSGPLLAVFRLTKYIMLVASGLFMVNLFMGSAVMHPGSFFALILKYLAVVFLIILIKNTNPRMRIDQAMRFFWGPVTLLSLIAVVLALSGR